MPYSAAEADSPPLKDKAADAAHAAKQASTDVAQTAADKVKEVAEETTRQARDLLGEARDQLRQQTGSQHRSLVSNLRSLGDELGGMTQHSEQSGVATELVSQARDRVHGAADWLDRRGPGDLVEEIRSLARRRPGAFLLGAALTGVLAGRLTKGVAAVHNQDASASHKQASGPPAAPATQPWPAAPTTQPWPAAPAAPAAQPWPAAPAAQTWPAPEAAPSPQYGAPSPYGQTQAIGYGTPPADPAAEGYPAQLGGSDEQPPDRGPVHPGTGASGQVWQ
ncbi:MAG: hypothetical protein DLM57_13455 [Pseudonocardiales bacterium]|nr:MAG: hypothetical protein DLM57_13455 [Pseudonocardiales bacterium]